MAGWRWCRPADRVSIIPAELGEFPALRGYDDADVLSALAGRFAQQQVEAGTVVAQAGTPISSVLVVVHGRLVRSGTNAYGEQKTTGVIADGGFFGASGLTNPRGGVE